MLRTAIVDYDAVLSELLSEAFALRRYESVTVPGAEGAFDAPCTAEADLILVAGCPWAREACSTLLQTLRRDPRTAGMPIVLCSEDPKAFEDNGHS